MIYTFKKANQFDIFLSRRKSVDELKHKIKYFERKSRRRKSKWKWKNESLMIAQQTHYNFFNIKTSTNLDVSY